MTLNKRDERLKAWMEDYGSIVLGTAMRIIKNMQDAEDVFQETFIKAYCKNAAFRDEAHIKAWLIRVTVNDCLSRLRSGWQKHIVLCELPEVLANAQYDGREIHDLLMKLPQAHKDTIWLHYFAGYKTYEIAKMMNVSASTIRTRLHRARERLKVDIQRSTDYEYQ